MRIFHRLLPRLGKRKAMAIAKDHSLAKNGELKFHHLKPGAPKEPLIYNRQQGRGLDDLRAMDER